MKYSKNKNTMRSRFGSLRKAKSRAKIGTGGMSKRKKYSLRRTIKY